VDIRSEDWLDAAACHSAPPEGAQAPQVRLSDLQPDQKRELASFGLAAMASCAFLLTPLMLTGEHGRELPSTALAIQFAIAPAVTNSPIVPASATRSRTRPPARAPRALAGTPRPAPLLHPGRSVAYSPVALAATGRTDAVTVMMEDADSRNEREPQPPGRVKRGVSRVLFGDGRYRVKPFPTPAAEDQN
jgi:hypothetical protein